jgi:hypothetical protein
MAIPRNQTVSPPSVSDPEQLGGLFRELTPQHIGETAALPVAPNWPFFLLHWPEEWSVETEGLEEPTWLPMVVRHTVLPGCNLNRTLRRDDPPHTAYDQAILANQRKGAIYLDPDAYSPQYRKAAPCRDPITRQAGEFWAERWQHPRAPRRGKRLKFRIDRADFNAFRLDAVLDGTIPAPLDDVLEVFIDRQRSKVRRLSGLTGLEAKELRARVKEATDRLELMVNARRPAKGEPRNLKGGGE